MSRIIRSLVQHTGRWREVPLDSKLVGALLRPEAWPHPVQQVELIETHISWVLLTGEFAYKVKKPVELGFLVFRELGRRRFYCNEEVRLNRFWAPEIYLGVVPITMREGRPRVGSDGPAVEYAVRMRQFDQALRLDHQLEAGRLADCDMRQLAEEIAARHIVQASAPLATLERRLAARAAAGKDASEADLEVLRHQLRTREPLTGEEARLSVTVDTDSELDLTALIHAVQRCGRGG